MFVSIPVPLAGNDVYDERRVLSRPSFNPRSPRGERQQGEAIIKQDFAFQSPFPSRGTTQAYSIAGRVRDVSIPVPLAGNDAGFAVVAASAHWVSIPVPLAGNGYISAVHFWDDCKFQSPFPSRGTTPTREGGQIAYIVSIPVPLAGNDYIILKNILVLSRFNPRSPRGERLYTRFGVPTARVVSIPVPLAGNDMTGYAAKTSQKCFNPRSPRGERPDLLA